MSAKTINLGSSQQVENITKVFLFDREVQKGAFSRGIQDIITGITKVAIQQSLDIQPNSTLRLTEQEGRAIFVMGSKGSGLSLPVNDEAENDEQKGLMTLLEKACMERVKLNRDLVFLRNCSSSVLKDAFRRGLKNSKYEILDKLSLKLKDAIICSLEIPSPLASFLSAIAKFLRAIIICLSNPNLREVNGIASVAGGFDFLSGTIGTIFSAVVIKAAIENRVIENTAQCSI